MTLAQIQQFHMIAQTNNMRKAAELLFISQPSLSVSVQKLEEELGVTLLERFKHRISLTEEGRIFDTYCAQILNDVENASIHMKRMSQEKEYKIRLGCIEPLLLDFLPEKMRKFLSLPENHSVEFDVQEGTTRELIHKLKSGQFDFILCMAHDDEKISQKPLSEDPLVLIRHQSQTQDDAKDFRGSSDKARLLDTSPYNWDEIEHFPMLGYTKDSAMDEFLSQLWLSQNILPAYRYRLPNESAIAAMVSNGFGYAILPFEKALLDYAIDICPLPSEYSRTICITTLNGRNMYGASDRFYQALIQAPSKQSSNF